MTSTTIKLTPAQVGLMKSIERDPHTDWEFLDMLHLVSHRLAEVYSDGDNWCYIELTPAGRAWLAAHGEVE